MRAWCKKCQHGHEVINGKCERCGTALGEDKKIEVKEPELSGNVFTTKGGYSEDKPYANNMTSDRLRVRSIEDVKGTDSEVNETPEEKRKRINRERAKEYSAKKKKKSSG